MNKVNGIKDALLRAKISARCGFWWRIYYYTTANRIICFNHNNAVERRFETPPTMVELPFSDDERCKAISKGRLMKVIKQTI